ncbi:hypothetical protein B0I37DRAFT_377849 [Chaetomium sp. MPI-CAGE-AT-0009]|nr:hypothetical protein B0I37DRAFT_377849 [Chaetomium sp. MPI-CAGE-AT-0009]
MRSAQVQFHDVPREVGVHRDPAVAVCAHDSGPVVAAEVERIKGACAEAARECRRLERQLGKPEEWVDLRRGVCCFWDVDAHNVEEREREKARHPRLVPNMALSEALSIDEGPAARGMWMLGMVRGTMRLVTATAHCEELAVMWSPEFCSCVFGSSDELKPGCADFRKQLKNLVSRHPKLRTLYLLDPSVVPAGIIGSAGSDAKFHGKNASFHVIDPSRCDEWLTTAPASDGVTVLKWAGALATLLSETKKETQAAGDIQVKALACVPDPKIQLETLGKLFEVALGPELCENQALVASGFALWASLMRLGLTRLG